MTKVHKTDGLPLPREHGAWVMVYGSFLAGLIAVPVWKPGPVAFLLAAVTFAFLAQEPARLLLRKRGDQNTRAWLIGQSLAMSACGIALVARYHLYDLLVIGAIGAALFGAQVMLLRTPVQSPLPGGRTVAKRRDRTLEGELLAVPALALPASAATIALTGHLTSVAVWVWIACTLFFASGIVSVKLLLASAKHRKDWSPALRGMLGRGHCAYHGALLVIVALAAIRLGGNAGWLLLAAYLPAIVRAARVWWKLDGVLPPLKRVGMVETVIALVFITVAGAALRTAPLLHMVPGGQ